MGRWAQRRHNGGGPPTSVVLAKMVTAQHGGDSTIVEVYYDRDVTAANFVGTEFTAQPDERVSITVSQLDANALEVEFAGDVTDQTSIEYSGSVEGVLSPDSVPID